MTADRCPKCYGQAVGAPHSFAGAVRRVCQTENCWFSGPAEAFEPRPGPDELMDTPNPELTLNRFDAWPWDLPRGDATC